MGMADARRTLRVSYANDALRTAMLAVGGVHLQYCHNPKNQSAALRITRLAKQRVLHLVNLTLRDTDGRDRVVDQSETELVMAALLSCTIASVSAERPTGFSHVLGPECPVLRPQASGLSHNSWISMGSGLSYRDTR
jgi:hypothetical protein